MGKNLLRLYKEEDAAVLAAYAAAGSDARMGGSVLPVVANCGSGNQGITIAGGLPAPIVTCAHGTAYDIAGKGIVKTSAFENAVKMAARMANHLRA